MSRYYETKRQQYLDNLPDRRNKAEKTALQQIDANFMSGKENGEGSQEDVWVVRSPLWRSPQLSPLLKRLQEKIDKQPSASSSSHPQNTRVEGEPSTHSPPTSSPALALLPGDRQSPERCPSPNRIPPSPQSPQHCSGDESDGEPLHMLDTSPVTIRRRPNRQLQSLWD